jgi:hypothetical protein
MSCWEMITLTKLRFELNFGFFSFLFFSLVHAFIHHLLCAGTVPGSGGTKINDAWPLLGRETDR